MKSLIHLKIVTHGLHSKLGIFESLQLMLTQGFPDLSLGVSVALQQLKAVSNCSTSETACFRTQVSKRNQVAFSVLIRFHFLELIFNEKQFAVQLYIENRAAASIRNRAATCNHYPPNRERCMAMTGRCTRKI